MQLRKLTSIEDLFDTQRRELFSKVSELDKNMGSKYATLERAVLELAQKTPDVNPSQLLVRV